MESVCAFLSLIMAIVVLAAIGHFLWLAMTAVFRAVFRNPSNKSKAATAHSEETEELESRIALDLQAARRLVDYAQFKEWMPDEQLVALRQLIENYSGRVLGSQQPGESSPIDATQPSGQSHDGVVPQVVAPPPPVATSQPVTSSHPLDEPEPISPPLVAHIEPERTHPLDMPVPIEPRATRRPRVPLSASLMRAFMEKSNIRWIELISGSLIVVCSVGLVISLWNTLSATSRFFPSLVFLIATAAVHAAGQYTLRKWNLRSTSRGILHIGLMLIPLAVLVGILLSAREGQPPQLDAVTLGVIAIGTAVYGGAAVTACRALFAGRYLPISIVVVIGALTLIAIHFVGAENRLGHPASAVILIPLLGIGLANCLVLSQSAMRQPISSSGRSLRRLTMVLQLVLASLVPAYFWMMTAGGYSAIHETALLVAGVWLAGWASWGWTASHQVLFSRIEPKNKHDLKSSSLSAVVASTAISSPPASKRKSGGWLSVVALWFAIVCSLALAAILWQMSTGRLLFAGILSTLSVWWFVHGWRCKLLASHVAGALAGTLAMSLSIEWFLPDAAQQLRTADWFSFTRNLSLIASSVLVCSVGAFILFLGRSSVPHAFSRIASDSSSNVLRKQLAVSLLTAGGFVLFGATGLTTLASLVPWSSPAYGGNWAPIFLLVNGSVLLIVAIVGTLVAKGSSSEANDIASSPQWISFLFPIAQGFLLLGAVRLCQTATVVPDFVVALRPMRSWAVGAGFMGLVWSGSAALLRLIHIRYFSARSSPSINFAIHSLGFGAVFLSLVSEMFFVSIKDHFGLLSVLGWLLPATFALLFLALRESNYREFAITFSAFWVVSLVTNLGWVRQWWSSLGFSATVSLLVLSVLAVVSFSHAALSRIKMGSWISNGPRWSCDLFLRFCWISWLGCLSIPIVVQYWNSLSQEPLQYSSARFLWMPLDLVRCAIATLAAIGLAASTLFFKNHLSGTMRLWLASLPIVFAALVGCVVPIPYCVPTFLFVLAALLAATEIISVTRTKWGKRIYGVNQRIFGGHSLTEADGWIPTAILLGMGSLVSVTAIVVVSHIAGRLPEQLTAHVSAMSTWSGWLGNVARIALWFGSLNLVLAVRWFCSLWMAESNPVITRRGFSLGFALTLAITLAGTGVLKNAILLGLQVFTLVMVSISWKTLSFAATWNYLGLRQLDKGSSPMALLSKACGGARWRQAEKSAWNLWLGAITTGSLLSVLAAVLVALYPVRTFQEMQQLGGYWTTNSVALAIALWWVLGLLRGMSKFGLVAATLGMMGPMVAAFYGSWLMSNPTARIASVTGYEPYRLLVGIWLVSLFFGLIIRIHACLRDRQMSHWAELSWVGLAVLVAVMAIAGLPLDSHWASAQLCFLAIIIAVSSEASSKAWRGWLAALAGILAWTPWMFEGGRNDWIFYFWQTLWGASGVGLICLATRKILQRIKQANFSTTIQQVSSGWTIDRAACLVVSGLSVAMSGLWILIQHNTVAAPVTVTWIVTGLVIANLVLAIGRLWDSGQSQRGLSVYLAVLASAVVLVNSISSYLQLPRIQAELAWLSAFLGAMTMMATLIRELSLQRLPTQRLLAQRLLGWRDLATPENFEVAKDWMAVWHTIAALVCLFPSVWLVLTIPNASSRLAAIALPILGAAAILPVSIDSRRRFQRGSVLVLTSATLILAWWADLPSAWSVRQGNESWLFVHRSFLGFVVLATIYPLIAWRRSRLRDQASLPAGGPSQDSTLIKQGRFNFDDWTPSLIIGGWVCLGVAILVGLVMIVGTGIGYWSNYPATVSLAAKCCTVVAWGILFARLVQAAARPFSIDRLTEMSSRSAMVYVAEIVLVLGGIAAYQHFPDLFSGVFLPWWPIIVFGIAFFSAGIGQVLQKAKQPVLADPIHQSSLLLPLIPLAGVWWTRQGSPAAHWGEWGSYWMLLAAASSLYGFYGWIRSSVWLRFLSVVAALLSFWTLLLSRPDLSFFERPQVWLLPPSIVALLFVEWNRKKLDDTTVTVSRYLCILIAYLSSTAEVFLKAMEGNLWQPLLLLFLALVGAFVGLFLRIRAFLYCGVAFIMVALFGMVWHATQAIDQVWPWWVFGIATGVGLLGILGYFEKNRSKVLKYLEELKTWQP